MMNWITIYNRLFEIINTPGETYFSGTKFLNIIREITYSIPAYNEYINQRMRQNKSTTRRDFFFDILMEQSENNRIIIITHILDAIGHLQPERAIALKLLIEPEPQVQGPQAQIPEEIWNADRLIDYLERMDTSITEGNYELTLTLAYTCLEGFYKSFIRERITDQVDLNELLPMSVQLSNYIRTQLNENSVNYPEQVVTLISTITSAICNARNDFSDSHSGNRAEKWLAVYLRDNVNAIVRLLLNFI
jgi:hypothetical protein